MIKMCKIGIDNEVIKISLIAAGEISQTEQS